MKFTSVASMITHYQMKKYKLGDPLALLSNQGGGIVLIARESKDDGKDGESFTVIKAYNVKNDLLAIAQGLIRLAQLENNGAPAFAMLHPLEHDRERAEAVEAINSLNKKDTH